MVKTLTDRNGKILMKIGGIILIHSVCNWYSTDFIDFIEEFLIVSNHFWTDWETFPIDPLRNYAIGSRRWNWKFRENSMGNAGYQTSVTFKLYFLTSAIYQWQRLGLSMYAKMWKTSFLFFHGCVLAKSQPLPLLDS